MTSDTNSSPFCDYTNDVIYVGDDKGVLYKYTGIFQGTPTRVVNSFYPRPVHNGTVLTGPVYDQTSGNIYVGDSGGLLSYLRETGSTVGTCTAGNPPCFGSTTLNAGRNRPILDTPIVDSTTQQVLVFVGSDNGRTNAAVYQTPTSLASSVEAAVGPIFTNNFYAGAFDNAYYNSVASGHLYTCGNKLLAGNVQVVGLYRIGFNAAGVMNSSNDGNFL